MQNVKPSWKKLETYLVIAALGALIYLFQKVPEMNLAASVPPQWSALVQMVIGLAIPALVGFFTKLRHDAYVNGGIPDDSAPVAGPVSSTSQAVAVLSGQK